MRTRRSTPFTHDTSPTQPWLAPIVLEMALLSCTTAGWAHVLSPWLVRDAMDYFRALNKAQEVSQRALDLTTHVIDLNPANYTVWCATVGDAWLTGLDSH